MGAHMGGNPGSEYMGLRQHEAFLGPVTLLEQNTRLSVCKEARNSLLSIVEAERSKVQAYI